MKKAMITININEFRGYDLNAIKEFLELQNDRAFQIVIPKLTTAIKDNNFEVFLEYTLTAYAGQLLSEIGEPFSYYVPSVYEERPYVFDVEIEELDKFASILFTIIATFNEGIKNEDDKERIKARVRFEYAASRFYSNACEDDTIVETWGLLSIANEYLAMSILD
ncbi:MAG: hypothetical protein ABI760_25425 [Ferruginibacter sp.]